MKKICILMAVVLLTLSACAAGPDNTAGNTAANPAANPAETTHWFSTDEVLAAIRDIDPSANISREQVFSALRDAGYDFCNRPGSHGLLLRWMFREKS